MVSSSTPRSHSRLSFPEYLADVHATLISSIAGKTRGLVCCRQSVTYSRYARCYLVSKPAVVNLAGISAASSTGKEEQSSAVLLGALIVSSYRQSGRILPLSYHSHPLWEARVVNPEAQFDTSNSCRRASPSLNALNQLVKDVVP